MTGLAWLCNRPDIGNWLFCLTFVRGAAEREVLAAFGADPGRPVPSRQGDAPGAWEESVVRVGETGQWLFVLEEGAWPPMGTHPEVLQRVSRGGEAVMVFHEIGKQNHEFAHAYEGEIMAALTTTVPPAWGGSDPQRLIPLASELGLSDGGWDELTSFEAILALAEGVFGVSLEEADIQRARPVARIAPVEGPRPGPGPRPPGLADPSPARVHVQRLTDAGMDPADIARLGGMTPVGIDRLLRGALTRISVSESQRLLAIEVP